MRTIEETREYVKKLWQEIEDGDPRARFNGPHCPGCLYSILEFIDSEPPCEHKRCIRFPLTENSDAWFFGAQDIGINARPITFCPDCGQKLEEACEQQKK